MEAQKNTSSITQAGSLTRKGAIWSTMSVIFTAVLQIIQMAVLARLLTPGDFGLAALVNIIIMVVTVLQDAGITNYLVHRQNLTKPEVSSLYWFTVGCGFILAACTLLFAPVMSYIYGESELTSLIAILSVNFIVISLGSQYQTQLIKNFRFGQLAGIEAITRIVHIIVACILAYKGYGAYAIIIAMLASTCSKSALLMLWADRQWWPEFTFQFTHIKPALTYGVYHLAGQVLNQLRSNLDKLIIGKIMGTEILGIYYLAKQLVEQPARMINPVINRLALPNFSIIQNDTKSLQATYAKTLGIVSLIVAPAYLCLAIAAMPAVLILYGSDYGNIAQLVPLLIPYTMFKMFSSLTGALAQACGRTKLEFKWNVISAVITAIATIVIALFADLELFAIGLSLTRFILLILSYYFFVKPVTGIKFITYLNSWANIITLFASIAVVTRIIFITEFDADIQVYIDLINVVIFILAVFFVKRHEYIALVRQRDGNFAE